MPLSVPSRAVSTALLATATVLAAVSVVGAGTGAQTAPMPRFVDVSDRLGLDFVHSRVDNPEKYLPDTMGSGLAWTDFDVDGRLDLYFVDAGETPLDPRSGPVPGDTSGANALYRAGPGPTLRLAPTGGDPGYGQGASFGDFDNDGWPDLYVANFGPNRLYRNNGDGSFDPVPLPALEDEPMWTSSAAWGDLDLDGFLDLMAVNYLIYDPRTARPCGQLDRGMRTYCPPDYYEGARDLLYHNLGDGSFREMAAGAGVANAEEGKGLGLVIGDVDADGLPDVYVANDSTRNFLYRNLGGLRFEDQGVFSGTGYGDDGRAQSGMGTDLGDVDGDGNPDIVVTNFSGEPYNLYRAAGGGFFVDATYGIGLGRPSLPMLGFGVALADLDGDLDLDLAIANGHLHQHLEDYAQANQVFVNRRLPGGEDGELFVDVTAGAGEALLRERVTRGLAVGDVDGDGWPDLAFSNLGDPGEVLLNVTEPRHRRLVLRFRGRGHNRDGLHARVRVLPEPVVDGGPSQLFQTRSASSYQSQGATDLYVGLGQAPSATLEITWPGGERLRLEGVEGDRLVLVVEGRGMVASRPLAARMPAP